jgi:hypothetical protein
VTATVNGSAAPRATPQQVLFQNVAAVMQAGYTIVMLELGWDDTKGKKRLVQKPASDWQLGDNPSLEQVAAAIRRGCNAYFYSLPAGTYVVDADSPETRAEMTALLGEPDVITGSGGAHWLVDAWMAERTNIDTAPRQLYGPGSFYQRAGQWVWYLGAVPAGPRPLPAGIPRRVEPSPSTGQKPDTPAPESGLGAWSAQADERPISVQYALRRAAEWCDTIATGPEDGAAARQGINDAAMFLGGLVAAGLFTAEHATERLYAACTARWGSVSAEDMQWIETGLYDGEHRKPLRVYDPTTAPVVDESTDTWTARAPLGTAAYEPACMVNDQAYAHSLAYLAYPAYRYDSRAGLWMDRHPLYRGQPDEDKRSIWRTADRSVNTPRKIVAAAGDLIHPGTADDPSVHHKMHTTSKTSGGIAAKLTDLVNIAGYYLADVPASDPRVFWGNGQPWDIATGRRAPLPLSTPHTQHSPYAPQSGATPEWDRWLELVWPDAEIREWALLNLSVGFTGLSPSVVPLLWGRPGTGKSATVFALMRLLTPANAEEEGYARTTTHALVDTNTGGSHAEAVLNLRGSRFVYLDEGPPRNPRTGNSQVEEFKRLTAGGIPLSVAGKYKSEITFTPTHTLVLTTNNPPDLSDEGVARRARVIPCTADPGDVAAGFGDMDAAFHGEAPAILARMLEYAGQYLANPRILDRVREPITVRHQTDDLVNSGDMVAEWLSEMTEPDEKGTRSSALRDAFAAWKKGHAFWSGERTPSTNEWGNRVEALGYPALHRKDANYRALRIRPNGGAMWLQSPLPAGGVEAPGSTEGGGSTPGSTRNEPGQPPISNVGGTGGSMSVKYQPIAEQDQHPIGGKGYETASTSTTGSTHSVPAAPETILCPRCGGAPGVTAAGKLRAHRLADKSKCEGSGDRAPGVLTKSERDRAAKVAAAEGEWIGLPAAMRRGEEPRAVTVAELPEILAECLRRNGGILAVDVENTARPIGHPDYRVQSVQLGDWAEGVDLDPHDPEQAEIIRAALAAAAELNAHNATADLAPLAHLGLGDYREMFDKMVDTAVRMKLADPASVGNEAGLKDLSPAVLGAAAVSPGADEARKALFTAAGWLTEVKPETPPEKNGWAQVKPGCATMVRYAIADVLDCAAIRHRIPAPEPAVERRERRVQVITAPTAYAGVPLDAEQVSGQIAEREPVIEELGARLAAAGLANARSPKQVTEAFTARGVTIPDSTKFTMQKLVALHPDEGVKAMAADVLAYRKAATFMSTFLVPWREQCERGDGVIRPTIYTLGADTGRMSSVRPNAQNLPKKGGARECWVAGPGKKIIRADMSSVEVRVIAALSQDPQLMAMLANGLKLHDRIAEQVFGPGYTETQRGWAKNGVFAHFFGAGLEKLAATIQAPLEVAAAVVEALGVVAPGVAAWADQVRQAVRGGMNQFRTYSGRVIHLDTSQPHKAVNYLVQGTARELLVDTLLAWDDGPYAGGVIVPVHDEVIAWVDEADADAATEYLVRCMTRELYGVAIVCEPDPPSDRWDSYAS